MTDRNLRYLVGALVVMLVVVVGLTVVVLAGRDGGTAAATPTPSAAASLAAASASPNSSAAPASAAPSAAASLPAVASPTAGASASPLPAPLATMTFIDLALDATDDPAGQDRTITFRSDGAGTITARLASSTPQGTTHMCLRVGAKDLGCHDQASGTFTGKTSQAHANWRVTLRGTGIATPVVSLTVTFQAVAPSVKIANARFDGTDSPTKNGIQARFTARAGGDAQLVAIWGGHPFQFEIDLFDETSGTGNVTLADQGPSTGVDKALPVAPGDWRILLQNIEGGFGTTDLTATIAWP